MNNGKGKWMTCITLVLIMILSSTVVFAAGDWGQNASEWVQSQVWYVALAVIAVVAVRFIVKKMWVQLGGFLVLAAIVLVIISGPEKLKDVGETIWSIIFR